MIISHRCRFVYLSPPKTASTSLHHWLSQPSFRVQRWKPRKQHDQHSVDIPEDCRGYFTFASVRHPLDRNVSLWSHSQSNTSLRHDNSWPMDFEEFLLVYQPKASWFYQRSQVELLTPVRLDAVVRFDRLEEDLFSLPPIAAVIKSGKPLEPLPILNSTKHARWQELCTPELATVIMERHGEDVGLFSRR